MRVLFSDRGRRAGGLGLIELMVVLAILALAGSVAIPPMLEWRHGMRLRAAAGEIRSDLESARMRAVRENTDVAVQFYPPTGLYQVTYSDAGGDPVLVKAQALPSGVRLATENAYYTLDSFGHRVVFAARGTARTGTLVLANPRGATRRIVINYLGRIEVRN
jgi:type IV fimbrial biogenesis protein FimT